MKKYYNRTRSSRSIPKKLLLERKWHLIPVYYAMLCSELANEGINNSGSYKFADHIYASKPRGRYGVGHVLDAILLQLPSARSMKNRYLYAKQELSNLVDTPPHQDQLDILAAPSGLAREFFETANHLDKTGHPHAHRIKWYGLDLDPNLVVHLQTKAKTSNHAMHFMQGDAMIASSYNQAGYDMIISIGFTEFLDDAEVIKFYRLIKQKLKPQGRFMTSGMLPHPISDYLLRNIAELYTHYRSPEQLALLAEAAGFTKYRTYQDKYKLQTILVAED